MIAKYKDRYYNISTVRHPTRIWRYDYVEGFERKVTRKGTVYYEKLVNLNEVEEIFNVGFSAVWHGERCGASPFDNNTVQLLTNSREFAESVGMNEFERGVFRGTANISECHDFLMKKDDYLTKTTRYIEITADEFKVLYKQLWQDLIPPG